MKRSALFIGFLITATPLMSWGSIVNPATVQKHSQIEVCFASWDDLMWARFDRFTPHRTQIREITSPERKWIKKTLTREFTEAKTIVDFVGWDSCIENPFAAIFILGGGQPPHSVLAKGTRHHFKLAYAPQRFIYANLNQDPKDPPKDAQKGALIRELALAVGLADESLREEARQDPQCARLPEGKSLTILKDRKLKKLTAYATYDPQSITHRCNLNPIHLSESDIHTLRCIYGFTEENFNRENCRRDYHPQI